MHKISVVIVAAVLASLGACQKQQSDAERNAEIEREVQARMTAERQQAEQQRLAARQAELDAREKALREKQADAAARERVAESPSGQTYQAPAGSGESYSIFYTRLDPYGAWLDTPTYGYVWQPREAVESRAWRPYTNGHWVYTDAGWTWISEEPFGWATYHYGRWTRLRGIGWVWVPGDEWAPAWVSWRVSNDYVGWAPLPPEAKFEVRVGIHNWADNYYDIGPEQYCFVPARAVGAERVERVVVPPEQNVQIVNQTTNVTNITYNNTVLVNQGPNYEQLRARSEQPIPRLRLERRTTVGATEAPRPIVKEGVVEVAAPMIAAGRIVERPPAIKTKITETVVEHGWEGVENQPAAQQARAKIKSEATPPPNAPPKTFVKPAPVAGQPRAASPAPRVTAAPIARSTIPPAPPPAAAPGGSAAPARQVATPPQTPAPTAAPRPRGTPAVGPLATGTPAVRSTPKPAFSPPALPPQFTPAPTSTPAASAPSAFGHAAETKEQRRAEKQLRKQERSERRAEHFQAATATPAVSSTPSNAAAPANPRGKHGNEDKRQKRSGESETSPTPTPAASP